tara:strand:- start:159 stop:578 length:420 start_codon:yes stop_codon:yes gene_type:complete
MAKLSLNKAAKEAGVAKSTLLQALNSKRMSAEKNEKGHWEIETSELFRVFPRTSSTEHTEPKPTPHEEPSKNNQNSALEVEVKMLREKIEDANLEREREREQASEQIERQSADHRQARRQSQTNARNIRQSRPDGFLGC